MFMKKVLLLGILIFITSLILNLVSAEPLDITINSPIENGTYNYQEVPLNITTNKPSNCEYILGWCSDAVLPFCFGFGWNDLETNNHIEHFTSLNYNYVYNEVSFRCVAEPFELEEIDQKFNACTSECPSSDINITEHILCLKLCKDTYKNDTIFMTTEGTKINIILDRDNDEVLDNEDKCPNTEGEQIVYGCSCEQILDLKPGEDTAENREECSKGLIDVFTKVIGWAKDLF